MIILATRLTPRAKFLRCLMSDILVITAFFAMVIAPCAVALHASLAEEGPELGYAASLRRLRARIVDSLRV